jgi:hypothetical protein
MTIARGLAVATRARNLDGREGFWRTSRRKTGVATARPLARRAATGARRLGCIWLTALAVRIPSGQQPGQKPGQKIGCEPGFCPVAAFHPMAGAWSSEQVIVVEQPEGFELRFESEAFAILFALAKGLELPVAGLDGGL